MLSRVQCEEKLQGAADEINILSRRPEAGIRMLFQGMVYEDFDRPLPHAVEATVFGDFEDYFNETQVCPLLLQPQPRHLL